MSHNAKKHEPEIPSEWVSLGEQSLCIINIPTRSGPHSKLRPPDSSDSVTPSSQVTQSGAWSRGEPTS